MLICDYLSYKTVFPLNSLFLFGHFQYCFGSSSFQLSHQAKETAPLEEPPTTDVHVPSNSDDTSDTELQVRIHVV